MNYYSTRNKNVNVTLREAVIRGLAPDNGLYMPARIDRLPDLFFKTLSEMTFEEMSFHVAQHLLADELPPAELSRMIRHTITFDAPLVEIDHDVFALELFHGPTLAFKDFGARFMSQLLGYFAKEEEKEIVILAATSGDTGSAVANGFFGVEGTRVVVLYPKGKVSDIQEKQFTTLGQNIIAIEIDGTFDDCQRLVKQAFQDQDLRQNYFLTSANSINIARLIPQSFYYFYAFSRLQSKNKPIVFSVPSGNFGNVTGGLLAKRMGLPIDHFVVATNRNDIVPKYLQNGTFEPRPSLQTMSNAMDVGNPSNFERIADLFNNDLARIRTEISGYAFSDNETAMALKQVKQTRGYVMDPHGAVGYCGLKQYLDLNPNRIGVFLETAHPGKFKEVVELVLNESIKLPESLQKFLGRKKLASSQSTDFSKFKATLHEALAPQPK